MKTLLFRIAGVLLLFCFSCSSEHTTNDKIRESLTENAVEDVAEDSNVTIIDAEAIYLNSPNPDQVLMELESTLVGSELVQALINVDQPTELLISHVSHEEQLHLIFDHAKEVVQLDLTYLNANVVDPVFRVSIRHKVKDYKTWKWLYDGDQKSRENAGMVLVQMGTVKGDPNEIFVIFAIPDIAKAREMMEKPNLLNKMKQGGVLGDPEIKFWRPAANS